MSEGYIMLHRRILEWEWYKDLYTYKLFTHLLLIANHSNQKWQGMEIKRGQTITSINSLSVATGLSVRNVRTSLNRLKSTNELTIKTTNKYSIITICKYDCYQGIYFKSDKQSDKQVTRSRQASDKQVTTNNNYNNENNYNNAITLSNKERKCANEVAEFYNIVCKKMSKVRKINNQRGRAILNFLSEVEELKKEDKELAYQNIFFMASDSFYLNGDNEREWKANFDWIIKNWIKIYEGQYNNN